MIEQTFITKTKELIDGLKSVCANHGLGNDGNEYKIITQMFLYKFINDKFFYEAKQKDAKLANAVNFEQTIASYSENDYNMLLLRLPAHSAKLKKEHFLSYLHNRENENEFYKLVDDTLVDIGTQNASIFAMQTDEGTPVILFEGISKFIDDQGKKNAFCKSLINKLVNFSFEAMFAQKYDFFSTIFEYLIKDYNKDGGGKYAEYYTPHSVAKIMAAILVQNQVKDVSCYDPSAGSGTLLMSIAHAIGEDKCSIFSQDISQKSSSMLRLNLILNNLVHSINNIIKGDTIRHPYHREKDGSLKKFDYIVSNPPFKLDFSEYRESLDTDANKERFFAGIPNILKKDVDKMPIYLLFIQHIMHSLSSKGKAAIVVPTGFITAQSGIEKKIREKMVEKKMLHGAISMPSNIFATTGTNVSIIFVDKENTTGKVVLVDASNLGKKVKDGKNQKTLLSQKDEQQIINAFKNKEAIEDFSVVLDYSEIKEKDYSFAAGQYFDIKIDYINITKEEFDEKMNNYKINLRSFFMQSRNLEKSIEEQLESLSL